MATNGGYPNSLSFIDFQYWAQGRSYDREPLDSRNCVRKRRFVKPNKKKLYAEGTVFCLRYTADGKRRWETLHVPSLNAALVERATKEAALLSEVPTAASSPAKRIKLDDAIATYLSTVAATLAHRTWLAYNLALKTFRESCAKERLDEIDKNDLTGFVVALKKDEQDDRTVANRVANVVTFLRAHGIVTVTLRHKYSEKKVKAYSVEELRARNAASTDEELQIWQCFLGTGFCGSMFSAQSKRLGSESEAIGTANDLFPGTQLASGNEEGAPETRREVFSFRCLWLLLHKRDPFLRRCRY